MSDYIKREDAYKAFKRVLDEDFPYISEETPRERITAIPSADVVEVRHGKWKHKDHIYGAVYCSECDYELTMNNTNYCPNCGARMDGDEE